MNKLSVFFREYYAVFAGFACIFAILLFLTTSPRGHSFTNQFFDPLRITTSREDVVIVGIDDKSLQEFGAWPFDRSIFALLTKALDDDKARSIIYDVLFLEPRSGDNAFKDALVSAGTPVVLASKIENGNYLASYLAPLSSPRIYSSLANVEPDSDGKVRRYPLPYIGTSACVQTLSQTAFGIAIFKQPDCKESSNVMFRYPTQIPVYSLSDILSNKITAEKIKDKTVFVGSVSLDLLDHFVGITGEKIPGVYVHASIFTSLLNKESDRNSTLAEIALLLLLYMGATVTLVYRSKSLMGQLGALIALLGSSIAIALSLFSQGVQIPVPWLVASIIVTGAYITLYRFIKERKKSEYVQSLFSKYVHKDVLKELIRTSSSLDFSGEKRDMSILFSDLRGFTTLSESLSPEELTRILNAYFSAMTSSILNEKGTIDKFIGDAVMAFWNAPLHVHDHPTHAVKAGLHMQQALLDFNEKHGTSLAMGVGVHRGEVIVGNVGSEERVNYTILGDAVNLASRIEGLTKKYGVLTIVSEDIKDSVHDANILFRKLDVITVKGKAKPTVLYEVKHAREEVKAIFEEYEKAFADYQTGKFDEAEIIFKTLADNGDGPSLTMLERIPHVRKLAWDGVWHFDEK